jgi:hypothetical protein
MPVAGNNAAEVRRQEARAELLRKTLALWQPRTSRRLSEEDARQCLENMVGFFRVLHEWDMAEKKEQKAKQESLQSPISEECADCRQDKKGIE